MDPNNDEGGKSYESNKPLPEPYPLDYRDPNPWLPGTDWSRDGIIGKQTP